jgi:hypothetical protein
MFTGGTGGTFGGDQFGGGTVETAGGTASGTGGGISCRKGGISHKGGGVLFGGGVNLIKFCGDQVSFDLFGGFHVREI